MLLQSTMAATAATSSSSSLHCYTSMNLYPKNPSFSMPKTLFLPLLDKRFYSKSLSSNFSNNNTSRTVTATLLETPVLWAGRLCIFYALLKAGFAGSPTNPLVSDLEAGAEDLGFSKWFDRLSKPEKEAAEGRKLVSKWHPTTKGFRIRSNEERENRENQDPITAVVETSAKIPIIIW